MADFDDPRTLGLLAAGLAMLSSKGNAGQALGQGGLLGLQAMQGAKQSRSEEEDRKARREMQQLQMEQMRAQMAEQQRASQGMQAATQAATVPPMGPPDPQGNMQPGGFDFQKFATGLAQVDPMKSFQMLQAFQPKEEEYATEPRQGMVGDKLVNYLISKTGKRKILDDIAPKPDLKEVDVGDRKMFVDPIANFRGPEFRKSMTPGEVASNDIGRANLGLRQKEIDTKNREVDAMLTVGGGQANREVGKLVGDVRKELNGLPQVKNYREALPAYESAKIAPDTPAGDIDLIYAVGKTLDPNSVVREGELNLVIRSGSPLQKFTGYVNYIKGGGRLPKAQREQLIAMLENRMGQLKMNHDQAVSPYRQQVKRMGLPEDEVFAPEAPATSGAPDQKAIEAELRRRGLIK
jgi:hypothetical protein